MSVLSKLTRGFESVANTPLPDKVDAMSMDFGQVDEDKSVSEISVNTHLTSKTTLSMLPGSQGEKEYFKLLWLSNMLNVPDVLVDQLAMLDSRELYREVLKDGKKFHQF